MFTRCAAFSDTFYTSIKHYFPQSAKVLKGVYVDIDKNNFESTIEILNDNIQYYISDPNPDYKSEDNNIIYIDIWNIVLYYKCLEG